MEIIFLGTSGYGVTSSRNLPSLIIDRQILIDCGEGCLSALYKHKIPVESIKAIFITHFHADHILGLIPLLYKLAFYSNNAEFHKKRISPPIYIPIGMSNYLKQIIHSTFSSFNNVNFEIQIIELNANFKSELQLNINNISYKINWIQTVHSPICNAFKLNDNIVISGDTAPFPEFLPFIEGVHTLIHEATFSDFESELAHTLNHSTPLDVAKIAKKGGIKQVFLYHVPDIDKIKEKIFIQQASSIYPNICVSHDGDRIKILNSE